MLEASLSTSIEIQTPSIRPIHVPSIPSEAQRFAQKLIFQPSYVDLLSKVSTLSLECQRLSREREELRTVLFDYERILTRNNLISEAQSDGVIHLALESTPIVTAEQHERNLERLASLGMGGT